MHESYRNRRGTNLEAFPTAGLARDEAMKPLQACCAIGLLIVAASYRMAVHPVLAASGFVVATTAAVVQKAPAKAVNPAGAATKAFLDRIAEYVEIEIAGIGIVEIGHEGLYRPDVGHDTEAQADAVRASTVEIGAGRCVGNVPE